MVFLNFVSKKKSADDEKKKHEKFPSMQRVKDGASAYEISTKFSYADQFVYASVFSFEYLQMCRLIMVNVRNFVTCTVPYSFSTSSD